MESRVNELEAKISQLDSRRRKAEKVANFGRGVAMDCKPCADGVERRFVDLADQP